MQKMTNKALLFSKRWNLQQENNLYNTRCRSCSKFIVDGSTPMQLAFTESTNNLAKVEESFYNS